MEQQSLPRWTDWARELQALAQAGLEYSKDPFDWERFQRIRDISAEMVAEGAQLPLERVKTLFCGESGYQTPKLVVRAAVILEGQILLVQERNGLWALPGGWVDEDQSVASNTVKEVMEEAGIQVRPLRLIAVQDRDRHHPLSLRGVSALRPLRSPGRRLRPQPGDPGQRLVLPRLPAAPGLGQDHLRADRPVLYRPRRPQLDRAVRLKSGFGLTKAKIV